MPVLQEISKLIPRGLLTETAGGDDLVKHILELYKHDPTSPHLKTMVRLFIASQRAKDDKVDPELLVIAKSMGIKIKKPVNETFSAEEHDKIVGRFAQGFNLGQITSMLRVKKATSDEQVEIFDEILSNKEVVIKRALTYLKEDDLSSLLQLMFYARKYGYDYPEFKIIEKSMPKLKEWGGGGKSADRGSDRGYRDDDDIQFITRKRGKKVQKNIIVKESYSVIDSEMGVDDDEMYFYLQDISDADHDPENIEFTGIKFNSNGHFDGIFSKDKAVLKSHRKEIIEAILDDLGMNYVSKHEVFIKQLLIHIKNGVPPKLIALLIFQARDKGYDYPEFKVIEKSTGESLSENFVVDQMFADPNDDDGVVILVKNDDDKYYDGIEITLHPTGEITTYFRDRRARRDWAEYKDEILQIALDHPDFNNKPKYLKKILQCVKSEDYAFAKALINLAREAHHDYPEFKMIEKSINQELDANQGYN